MKTRSLSVKITLVAAVLALIMMMIVLLVVYGLARNHTNIMFEEKTRFEMDALELNLNKVRNSIELTAALTLPKVTQCMSDTTEVTEVLTDIVKNNQFISCAAVAYAPNRLPGVTYNMPVIANYGFISNYFGDKERNGDYTFSDWYIVPSQKGVAFWTDPYVNILDSPVVSYAVPITSEGYGFEGVLTLAVELNYMNKLLAYQPNDSTSGGLRDEYMLFDRNTTFLTTPQTEFIMNETLFTLAESKNDTTYSYIGREIVAGHNGQTITMVEGEESVATWRILPELNWAAMIITPRAALYTTLHKVFITLILLGFLAVMIVITVFFYQVRKLLTPIRQLKSVTQKMSEGNGDVEMPASLTSRQDEIGVLGREIARMRDTISADKELLESERQDSQHTYDKLTTLIHNVAGHMKLPVSNMVSATDRLAALVGDDEEGTAAKNDVQGASLTAQQKISQLQEMASLLQEKDEHDDVRVVMTNEAFIDDAMKGIHQLEERFGLTINEEYRDRRPVKICTNLQTLKTLLYRLIAEAAKVGQTNEVGVYYTLDMQETAFRIMIEAKAAEPIPQEEKEDFFRRYAMQKMEGYENSAFQELYLCYRTARHLGAQLFVDHEYKEGNLFVIEMPKVE